MTTPKTFSTIRDEAGRQYFKRMYGKESINDVTRDVLGGKSNMDKVADKSHNGAQAQQMNLVKFGMANTFDPNQPQSTEALLLDSTISCVRTAAKAVQNFKPQQQHAFAERWNTLVRVDRDMPTMAEFAANLFKVASSEPTTGRCKSRPSWPMSHHTSARKH